MTDAWDYEIDPDYNPNGGVPPEGLIGAYQLVDGRRVGAIVPNPAYQPSTLAKALGRGADPILTAYSQFRRGAADKATLLAALAAHTVTAFQAPSGQPWVATVDGHRVFQVFTSEAHLRDVPEAPQKTIPGGQIAEVAALGVTIELNPHPEGTITLAPEFFTRDAA